MKVIGQVGEDTALVDLEDGQGQMVDLVSKTVSPKVDLHQLLRRFPWTPFKGDEEEVLAILKEERVEDPGALR